MLTNLRFGIRDLLWAMLVLGLVNIVLLQRFQAGLMKSELYSQRVWFSRLEVEFELAGGEVHYDEYGNVTPIQKKSLSIPLPPQVIGEFDSHKRSVGEVVREAKAEGDEGADDEG
jgi:hypothetical protein